MDFRSWKSSGKVFPKTSKLCWTNQRRSKLSSTALRSHTLRKLGPFPNQEQACGRAFNLTFQICFRPRNFPSFCSVFRFRVIISTRGDPMTSDPRYPIGKFSFDGTLTPDQKKQYLHDI